MQLYHTYVHIFVKLAEAIVALGYRLEQLLSLFRVLQTSPVHP